MILLRRVGLLRLDKFNPAARALRAQRREQRCMRDECEGLFLLRAQGYSLFPLTLKAAFSQRLRSCLELNQTREALLRAHLLNRWPSPSPSTVSVA